MKTPVVENIVITTLKRMLSEQAEQPSQRTNDNAESDSNSLFTPAEERFLGKFDAYGSKTLGVIYSLSDAGIREFIARSGKDLNLTPEILFKLIEDGVVKIQKYGGWGRDDQYTIKLQLSLNDVKGLGDEDEKTAENDGASGAAGAVAEPAMPAPEVAWVVKYGDVLHESVNIAVKLVKTTLTESKKSDVKVYSDKSRMIKQFPSTFIRDLNRILEKISDRKLTNTQTERLIADILDNLQVNLKLTPKNIKNSYDYHRQQKKLQKYLDKN